MTYIDEITGAVVRVLTHACEGQPHRFAGYVANADFWIGEARHCLDVIAGYDERFKKLQAATADRYDPMSGGEGGRSSGLTTRSTKHSDRSAARRQVTDAARRFLKRCDKTRALEQDALIALCDKVGVQYPP